MVWIGTGSYGLALPLGLDWMEQNSLRLAMVWFGLVLGLKWFGPD
jgi:hypothetical protein